MGEHEINEFVNEVTRNRLNRTKAALEANNFEVYVVADRVAAKEQVKALIPKGASIGVGGSETLNECDILSLIRNGDYNFIDRYEKGLSPDEVRARHVAALGADVYISGTNAITENGELYNVDGNGNRIAAIAFGPKSVIIIAGANKIVKAGFSALQDGGIEPFAQTLKTRKGHNPLRLCPFLPEMIRGACGITPEGLPEKPSEGCW